MLSFFKKKETPLVSRDDIEARRWGGIKKRFLIFGGIAFAVFIALFIIDFYNRYLRATEAQISREEMAKVNLPTDSFLLWQSSTEDHIKYIERNIERIDNNITSLIGSSMAKLQEDINKNISDIGAKVDQSMNDQSNKMDELKNNLERKIDNSQKENIAYVNEKIKTLSFENINNRGGAPIDKQALFLPSPSKGNTAGLPQQQKENQAPSNHTTTIETIEEPVSILEQPNISTLDLAKKPEEQKEKEIEFDIPMGMAKATIISGANAPIFNFGKSDEGSKPVFLSIDSQIILANNQVLDGRECLLLGGATGDIGTSRAEVRLSKISCTFVNTKTGKTYKVEEKIEGWVFGEDGPLGAKGRLVTQEGKIITAALPLALLETAMSYVSDKAKSGTTIVTTDQAAGLSGYAARGTNKGAENVIEKLSDIYVKYIEALNPVVSIMPGREVTVAFKGTGTPLKLKEFNGLDVGFFDREGSMNKVNNPDGNAYYDHAKVSGVEIYE